MARLPWAHCCSSPKHEPDSMPKRWSDNGNSEGVCGRCQPKGQTKPVVGQESRRRTPRGRRPNAQRAISTVPRARVREAPLRAIAACTPVVWVGQSRFRPWRGRLSPGTRYRGGSTLRHTLGRAEWPRCNPRWPCRSFRPWRSPCHAGNAPRVTCGWGT
jgi:hypothetical protein